jgi:hypothetical protein
MDAKFNILDYLQTKFKDKDFRPRVHAELNLLEHFYRKRLPFLDDDRFIAYSKPACYYCYRYISLHPGGFVRPSSHGIRYLNWRPPDLVNATDTREKNHQRDVLNKVIAQIRLDAWRQIQQCRGPSPWHPDSTTGITRSQKRDASVGGIDPRKLLEHALPSHQQLTSLEKRILVFAILCIAMRVRIQRVVRYCDEWKRLKQNICSLKETPLGCCCF